MKSTIVESLSYLKKVDVTILQLNFRITLIEEALKRVGRVLLINSTMERGTRRIAGVHQILSLKIECRES